MARILITGGAGFLGRKLVDALLHRGSVGSANGEMVPIEQVRVSDLREPDSPLPDDARVECIFGDFTAPGAVDGLVAGVSHVVHLAAAVSGECEQDFDLGMRVNLDGTRSLLEACRTGGLAPRFLFTSSVAVYGGEMPEVLDDVTLPQPQNSYGAQKVACEFLLTDMTRRGFVDGRTLRLPTVVVRPGKANAAASSFASAVIREPLEGRDYVCPVAPDTGIWVLSPRKVTEALLKALDMPADIWGGARSLKLPGITVTAAEMLDAVRRHGGDAVADRVSFAPDPFIQDIISGWPTRFSLSRAPALGFTPDDSIDAIVTAFVEDELDVSSAKKSHLK